MKTLTSVSLAVLVVLASGCGPRYAPDDNPAMLLDASGAEPASCRVP